MAPPAVQYVPAGDYVRVEFAHRSRSIAVEAPAGVVTSDPETIAVLDKHPYLQRGSGPKGKDQPKPVNLDKAAEA